MWVLEYLRLLMICLRALMKLMLRNQSVESVWLATLSVWSGCLLMLTQFWCGCVVGRLVASRERDPTLHSLCNSSPSQTGLLHKLRRVKLYGITEQSATFWRMNYPPLIHPPSIFYFHSYRFRKFIIFFKYIVLFCLRLKFTNNLKCCM